MNDMEQATATALRLRSLPIAWLPARGPADLNRPRFYGECPTCGARAAWCGMWGDAAPGFNNALVIRVAESFTRAGGVWRMTRPRAARQRRGARTYHRDAPDAYRARADEVIPQDAPQTIVFADHDDGRRWHEYGTGEPGELIVCVGPGRRHCGQVVRLTLPAS